MTRDHILGYRLPCLPLGPAIKQDGFDGSDKAARWFAERHFEQVDYSDNIKGGASIVGAESPLLNGEGSVGLRNPAPTSTRPVGFKVGDRVRVARPGTGVLESRARRVIGETGTVESVAINVLVNTPTNVFWLPADSLELLPSDIIAYRRTA